MTEPAIDASHEEMKKYVHLIANICISDNFLALKEELEAFYQSSKLEQPSVQAFQDALYTILAEEDFGQIDQKSC
ncbi:putative membrane protein YqiK [Desulfitispora alkaliphila]|uniref:hypothetical protein n=1 Tax=Desulfitispora alkaliphila TaxID=622674 RepID=UPI003D20079B